MMWRRLGGVSVLPNSFEIKVGTSLGATDTPSLSLGCSSKAEADGTSLCDLETAGTRAGSVSFVCLHRHVCLFGLDGFGLEIRVVFDCVE